MIYIMPDPEVCQVLMELLGSQSLVILLKLKMGKQQKISKKLSREFNNEVGMAGGSSNEVGSYQLDFPRLDGNTGVREPCCSHRTRIQIMFSREITKLPFLPIFKPNSDGVFSIPPSPLCAKYFQPRLQILAQNTQHTWKKRDSTFLQPNRSIMSTPVICLAPKRMPSLSWST